MICGYRSPIASRCCRLLAFTLAIALIETLLSSHAVQGHPNGSQSSTTQLEVNSSTTKGVIKRQGFRRRESKQHIRHQERIGATGDESETKIIRDLVGYIFGFKPIISTSASPLTLENGTLRALNHWDTPQTGDEQENLQPSDIGITMPHPPNFMIELYQALSENRSLTTVSSESRGNTVRSFFAGPAISTNWREEIGKAVTMIPITSTQTTTKGTAIPVFVYNVTSIPQSEELFLAEIRLETQETLREHQEQSNVPTMAALSAYKRRHQCHSNFDCLGNTAQIFDKVGETLLIHSSSATSWSNTRLAKLANNARKANHVLIVKFADGGSYSANQTEEMPAAFESSPSEIENRDDERLFDASIRLNEATPILVVYCNDLPKDAKRGVTATPADILGTLHNLPTKKRRKHVRRSAPVGGHASALDAGAPKSEKSGKRRQYLQKNPPPRIVNSRQGDTQGENTRNSAKKSSKETSDHTERPKRRNNKCVRKGRRRNSKCKKSKKDKGSIKLHPSLHFDRDGCGRKSLHVDFADIGWSDWIISPKFFDAYYCTGRCNLPKMQGSGTTNHAIIQAVMRSTRGGKHVPAPCCVPDKLMSLGVLFFDEDRNVVLKVFPDMSVETCACR